MEHIVSKMNIDSITEQIIQTFKSTKTTVTIEKISMLEEILVITNGSFYFKLQNKVDHFPRGYILLKFDNCLNIEITKDNCNDFQNLYSFVEKAIGKSKSIENSIEKFINYVIQV